MKRPGNPVEGDNSHIIRDSNQKIACQWCFTRSFHELVFGPPIKQHWAYALTAHSCRFGAAGPRPDRACQPAEAGAARGRSERAVTIQAEEISGRPERELT
jgi:hypothetical protein